MAGQYTHGFYRNEFWERDVDATGIGYTIFEPLFLAVGELQSSAAVTPIRFSNYVYWRRLDSLIHSYQRGWKHNIHCTFRFSVQRRLNWIQVLFWWTATKYPFVTQPTVIYLLRNYFLFRVQYHFPPSTFDSRVCFTDDTASNFPHVSLYNRLQKNIVKYQCCSHMCINFFRCFLCGYHIYEKAIGSRCRAIKKCANL